MYDGGMRAEKRAPRQVKVTADCGCGRAPTIRERAPEQSSGRGQSKMRL
jgi:hypothetical protein